MKRLIPIHWLWTIPEKTSDNEQISTAIPMSALIFQDMSPTNLVVKQQEKVHIQTQEYERKDNRH